VQGARRWFGASMRVVLLWACYALVGSCWWFKKISGHKIYPPAKHLEVLDEEMESAIATLKFWHGLTEECYWRGCCDLFLRQRTQRATVLTAFSCKYLQPWLLPFSDLYPTVNIAKSMGLTREVNIGPRCLINWAACLSENVFVRIRILTHTCCRMPRVISVVQFCFLEDTGSNLPRHHEYLPGRFDNLRLDWVTAVAWLNSWASQNNLQTIVCG